jgi:hypothetical protein
MRQIGADSMARNACDFMKELARRQHAFWIDILFWWIGVVVVVSVVSAYVSKAPELLLQAIVYGSFIITFYVLGSRVRASNALTAIATPEPFRFGATNFCSAKPAESASNAGNRRELTLGKFANSLLGKRLVASGRSQLRAFG